MDENITENIVRIGKVSSVNPSKLTARVIFEDKEIISGWLNVLQHPKEGEHSNDGNPIYWMPKVNEMVLVLYIPIFNGDGFILGVV